MAFSTSARASSIRPSWAREAARSPPGRCPHGRHLSERLHRPFVIACRILGPAQGPPVPAGMIGIQAHRLFEQGDGLFRLAHIGIDFGRKGMQVCIIRVCLQTFLKLSQCLLVLPAEKQNIAQHAMVPAFLGIQGHRPIGALQGLLIRLLGLRRQEEPEIIEIRPRQRFITRRVIGIQGHCLLKELSGLGIIGGSEMQ